LPSLHEWSLEITLTVPLRMILLFYFNSEMSEMLQHLLDYKN